MWEYMHYTRPDIMFWLDQYIAGLNELGIQGWEVVFVDPRTYDTILKRSFG